VSTEKILTKKIAERLLADCGSADSLYLDEFTNIEDDAAEVLTQHKGDLFLNGLRDMSVGVAKALAQHKGELWLGGLVNITISLAEALILRKSRFYLRDCQSEGSGVTLSNRVIQILSSPGSELSSIGINPCALDDATCVSLSKFGGSVLLCDYVSDAKFSISRTGLRALASRKMFHACVGNLDEESITFLKQYCRLESDEIWTRK
jgi:hypothetical protein